MIASYSPIAIIIVIALMIGVYYWFGNRTESFYVPVETITFGNDLYDVPDYTDYQPITVDPNSSTYVYVQDTGSYVVPYDQLDLSLPYDRWMYYYNPSYYNAYYAYDWPFNYGWPYQFYGGNYYSGNRRNYGGRGYYGGRGWGGRGYRSGGYRSGGGRNYGPGHSGGHGGGGRSGGHGGGHR